MNIEILQKIISEIHTSADYWNSQPPGIGRSVATSLYATAGAISKAIKEEDVDAATGTADDFHPLVK